MNLKNRLLSSSRIAKKILVASTDFISFTFSVYLASLVSNLEFTQLVLNEIFRLLWIPAFSVFIFYLFGVYRSVLRYIDFALIYLLFKAIITAFVLNFVFKFIFTNYINLFENLRINESLISNVGWLVGLLSSIVLIIASRIYANFLLSSGSSEERVVIYGAGSAGIQLAEALKVSSEMEPVAFFDSNPALENTYLGGVKILNPNKLPKFIRKKKIDEVLIAMPSASKETLTNLLKEIEGYSIKVRILPGLAALAQGKVSVAELKEIDILDLLGRSEVEPNQKLITKNIKNKVVLITGAGGSIGSEISRQVAMNKPRKLVLLDANEYALYSIKNEIEKVEADIELYSVLGNVTNKKRMTEVCKVFEVSTVYHAAAYKHVPIVEENPFEAIRNNILGTKIMAEAAIDADVETFVLVSTDKAVRPTNIMGATKRFSELILQSFAQSSKTRMTMVRFGNVIGSSGSAVPLFQQQIKDGGPVTVTHPEVTRYFMSIPEAAELVIQAGAMGDGGDVFVLDMGEPVKITELAKRLINLSGKDLIEENNPQGDIEIKFTGLRPGEKLYEELLIGDSVQETAHKRILKAQEDFLSSEVLNRFLERIEKAEEKGDVVELKAVLVEAVSGFVPEEEIVDPIFLHRNR